MSSNHTAAMLRWAKEVKALGEDKEFTSEIRVWLESESDLSVILAEIDGPSGTPFQGGKFRARLRMTAEFPEKPPAGNFVTKIFHPNVNPTTGEICVDRLKREWHEKLTLRELLLALKCLLIQPNAESALNEEAGKLLLEDFDSFCRTARLMTSIHALPEPAPATTTAEKKENVTANAQGTAPAPTATKVQPKKTTLRRI